MPGGVVTVGAAVSGGEITDLTVDTADIADNAVTGAKIAAISDEGVVISHTGGLVLSGAGGKDTLALSNTTVGTGITIGVDVNLYREGTNGLATDDAFAVYGANIFVANGAYCGGVSNFGPSGGGGPWDVTLYRDAANTLKTDDKLIVALELNAVGDLNHDGANVGFYGTTPIAKQTGVAVTDAGIHAALVNLGLIAA